MSRPPRHSRLQLALEALMRSLWICHLNVIARVFCPIDYEADREMQLVTVGVPMQEFYDSAQQEDTKTYDVNVLFLTLESAEKPIENK